jgi:hypothetical protein
MHGHGQPSLNPGGDPPFWLCNLIQQRLKISRLRRINNRAHDGDDGVEGPACISI